MGYVIIDHMKMSFWEIQISEAIVKIVRLNPWPMGCLPFSTIDLYIIVYAYERTEQFTSSMLE